MSTVRRLTVRLALSRHASKDLARVRELLSAMSRTAPESNGVTTPRICNRGLTGGCDNSFGLDVRATRATDKMATIVAILFGVFIVVFVSTFLWGVGKRIVRWTLIVAVAYAAVVMAVRAAHLGDDGAAITVGDLLSATLGPHCSLGGSTASRSSSCASSTR